MSRAHKEGASNGAPHGFGGDQEGVLRAVSRAVHLALVVYKLRRLRREQVSERCAAQGRESNQAPGQCSRRGRPRAEAQQNAAHSDCGEQSEERCAEGGEAAQVLLYIFEQGDNPTGWWKAAYAAPPAPGSRRERSRSACGRAYAPALCLRPRRSRPHPAARRRTGARLPPSPPAAAGPERHTASQRAGERASTGVSAPALPQSSGSSAHCRSCACPARASAWSSPCWGAPRGPAPAPGQSETGSHTDSCRCYRAPVATARSARATPARA